MFRPFYEHPVIKTKIYVKPQCKKHYNIFTTKRYNNVRTIETKMLNFSILERTCRSPGPEEKKIAREMSLLARYARNYGILATSTNEPTLLLEKGC